MSLLETTELFKIEGSPRHLTAQVSDTWGRPGAGSPAAERHLAPMIEQSRNNYWKPGRLRWNAVETLLEDVSESASCKLGSSKDVLSRLSSLRKPYLGAKL